MSVCDYIPESTPTLAWWLMTYLQGKAKVKQRWWDSQSLSVTYSARLAPNMQNGFLQGLWLRRLFSLVWSKFHWELWLHLNSQIFFLCCHAWLWALSSVSLRLHKFDTLERRLFGSCLLGTSTSCLYVSAANYWTSLRWSLVHIDFSQTDRLSTNRRRKIVPSRKCAECVKFILCMLSQRIFGHRPHMQYLLGKFTGVLCFIYVSVTINSTSLP